MNELTAFLKTRKKANLTIVAINVLVFIVFSIIGNTEDAQFMLTHGACFAPLVKEGEVYRLFTAMFLHFGVEHLIGNMLLLIFLGDTLERVVGSVRALPEELCSVGRRFRSTVCGDRGVGISCTEKKRRCRGNFRKKAAFDGSSFDRPGIYRGWN